MSVMCYYALRRWFLNWQILICCVGYWGQLVLLDECHSREIFKSHFFYTSWLFKVHFVQVVRFHYHFHRLSCYLCYPESCYFAASQNCRAIGPSTSSPWPFSEADCIVGLVPLGAQLCFLLYIASILCFSTINGVSIVRRCFTLWAYNPWHLMWNDLCGLFLAQGHECALDYLCILVTIVIYCYFYSQDLPKTLHFINASNSVLKASLNEFCQVVFLAW